MVGVGTVHSKDGKIGSVNWPGLFGSYVMERESC